MSGRSSASSRVPHPAPVMHPFVVRLEDAETDTCVYYAMTYAATLHSGWTTSDRFRDSHLEVLLASRIPPELIIYRDLKLENTDSMGMCC